MKKISRITLFGALTLILLLAACGPQEGSPTVVGPTLPSDTASPPAIETDTTETAETATTSPEATLDVTATTDPAATMPAGTDTTGTATTQTAGIPVTGAEMILLECQYCIEGTAHAVLILPDTATFQVVNDSASVSTQGTETGCFAVDSFNGRQTVICRAQENSSMTLDICPDGVNCTQLLVELQSCPQTAQPGTTNTPGADGSTTSTPATGETATQPVATTPTVTP